MIKIPLLFCHCEAFKRRSNLITFMAKIATPTSWLAMATRAMLRCRLLSTKLMTVCCLLFAACDPEPELIDNSKPDVINEPYKGMYILSEGLFNQNNSILTWIDATTCTPLTWSGTQGVSTDCFEYVNGRRLGDTANDMLLYGSHLYIAVTESSTIEVIEAATCRSLSQIKMSRDGKASQPRKLAAAGDYVYVCCFDGTVSRIDTLTNSVVGTVQVGRNPDGLCALDGKLYVANSGALDADDMDSTVSVIELDTFTETARITLRENPGSIHTDGSNVYVITRGAFNYDTMEYDSQLHRIDPHTLTETATYNLPILSMDVMDGKAWFYGYGKGGTIQVMDLANGDIITPDFITDGTLITCPYSIKVHPHTHNVYVTDAMDYVTPGSLCCFNPEGELLYRINGVGINPNSVSFCNFSISTTPHTGPDNSECHVSRVFEYCPAPGQFVNLLPKYEQGDDASIMATKCLNALQRGNTITLGGFGGYMTVGFHTPILNGEESDFRIEGNANNNSSEPGVVWVSADANHNQLPDDEWYELLGSEQHSDRVATGYSCTYYKPVQSDADTPWQGSDGSSGAIIHNSFHSQPYYPQWYANESVTFIGTLLPQNTHYEGSMWIMTPFEYGYVDNKPNSPQNISFDIEWAVTDEGTPIHLDSINFVRIQTAVIGCNDVTGEQSTEITGIYNINLLTE